MASKRKPRAKKTRTERRQVVTELEKAIRKMVQGSRPEKN
jgi:hypothetical protein